MGQIIACFTVAEKEVNDDTIYRPPPQEIEQPWKEKFKTDEGKVVLAVDHRVDPKFTEEEIAQDRIKTISSIFEERRVRPCVFRRVKPFV